MLCSVRTGLRTFPFLLKSDCYLNWLTRYFYLIVDLDDEDTDTEEEDDEEEQVSAVWRQKNGHWIETRLFIKLKLLNSTVLPGLSSLTWCCKRVHLEKCVPSTCAMVMIEAAYGCIYFQWTVWEAILIQVTNVARTSEASILKVPKEIVLDGTSRNYEFSLKWKRSEDMLKKKNPKAELRGRIIEHRDCQCAFFVDAHFTGQGVFKLNEMCLPLY